MTCFVENHLPICSNLVKYFSIIPNKALLLDIWTQCQAMLTIFYAVKKYRFKPNQRRTDIWINDHFLTFHLMEKKQRFSYNSESSMYSDMLKEHWWGLSRNCHKTGFHSYTGKCNHSGNKPCKISLLQVTYKHDLVSFYKTDECAPAWWRTSSYSGRV